MERRKRVVGCYFDSYAVPNTISTVITVDNIVNVTKLYL